MNNILCFSLSKVLTQIINNIHMNKNVKYQLMCMSNDICINLAEHNNVLQNRLDVLEKKINKLEESRLMIIENKKE
jgi:hypothetical protein